MAVRLSALRTSRTLLPRNIIIFNACSITLKTHVSKILHTVQSWSNYTHWTKVGVLIITQVYCSSIYLELLTIHCDDCHWNGVAKFYISYSLFKALKLKFNKAEQWYSISTSKSSNLVITLLNDSNLCLIFYHFDQTVTLQGTILLCV
jgi:hypothetical protein